MPQQTATELVEIQQSFTECMERYRAGPTKAHKDLTDCELRSLAHVNPGENIEGDEFYFERASAHPTMEEFRAAQNPSGYPLRLPIGLKQLKNHHDPELIKSFTNILGSLMQGTDGHVADYLKRKDFPSTISPNVLTVNHGNPARNPKLDSRELKSWPIKHRPLIMQMAQNSAHILCINEADSFLCLEEDKTVKLFIKCGHKSIACFVRDGKHARVELLARYISTKSQCWRTTFGMFRCFFGLEEGYTDPDYDTPTSDCLASTGTSMFINKEKYVGQRLPPRAAVQWHGKTCEIVVIHIEQNDEIRGAFPKSTKDPVLSYDTRHVTRADLPFATIGVFHIHPNISHGAAKEDVQKGIMPLVTEYQCNVITGDANTFSKLQSV